MKKILLATLLFTTAVVLVFQSCNKKETERNLPKQLSAAKETDSVNVSDCWKDVTIVCGNMLHFNDQAHFDQVYNCLDQAYEAYNNSFEAANAGLSDDAFDDLCDNTGFNEDQPLIDFETGLNFTSYRNKMAALESQWLSSGANQANNPENNDILEDEIMWTMFNPNGDVMIGNSIYHVDANGTVYQITNGDCSLLTSLEQNPGSVDGNPNVKKSVMIINTPNGTKCANQMKKSGQIQYNGGTRMYVWRLSFMASPTTMAGLFGGSTDAKASLKAYKYKNGHWKKRAEKLGTRSFGIATGVNLCIEKGNNYDKSKGINRRRKMRVRYIWTFQEMVFKTGQAQGTYNCATNSNTESLTF